MGPVAARRSALGLGFRCIIERLETAALAAPLPPPKFTF